jgi:hypothetical protein
VSGAGQSPGQPTSPLPASAPHQPLTYSTAALKASGGPNLASRPVHCVCFHRAQVLNQHEHQPSRGHAYVPFLLQQTTTVALC